MGRRRRGRAEHRDSAPGPHVPESASSAASSLARRLTPPLVYLLLAFVVRASGFVHTVFDWDESNYLLVARDLIGGHAPYTAAWDNKQPLLYLVVAASQMLFGPTVNALRIVTVLFVAGTSLTLHAVATRVWGGRALAGWIAGTLYAVYSAKGEGLASNAELFFVLPMALAFLVALGTSPAAPRAAARALGAGLLAGCAIQTKLVAVFDLPALAIALAVPAVAAARERREAATPAVARTLAPFVLGVVLPTAAVLATYLVIGAWRDYQAAQITANLAVAVAAPWDPVFLARGLIDRIALDFPLWTLAGLSLLGLRRRGAAPPQRAGTILLWCGFALLAVLATRRMFQHYFIQLLPPLSVLAAGAASLFGERTSRRGPVLATLALLALIGWRETASSVRDFLMVSERRRATGSATWGDTPASVAQWLRARLAPGEQVYVVDWQPILYSLLGQPLPTRYAFPPYLIDSASVALAGTDARREMARVMVRAPRYLVRAARGNNEGFYRWMDRWTRDHYEPVLDAGSCVVFRLRDGDEAALVAAVERSGLLEEPR